VPEPRFRQVQGRTVSDLGWMGAAAALLMGFLHDACWLKSGLHRDARRLLQTKLSRSVLTARAGSMQACVAPTSLQSAPGSDRVSAAVSKSTHAERERDASHEQILGDLGTALFSAVSR